MALTHFFQVRFLCAEYVPLQRRGIAMALEHFFFRCLYCVRRTAPSFLVSLVMTWPAAFSIS